MNLLRNPWVTGLLAIVAVALVWYQLFPPRPNALPPAGQVSSAPANSAAARDAAPTLKLSPKSAAPEATIDRDYIQAHLAGWIGSSARDPFQLFLPISIFRDTNTPPWARWKLKGIWRQESGSLAAINQGVYSEGEMLDGYRIDKIEDNQVWLQGPKLRERLTFDKVDIGVDETAPPATNSIPQPPPEKPEAPKPPEPAQPTASPDKPNAP